MPPPTAGDAWLASRRFGIVIDAGSSGSRLQLYSWLDTNAVRTAGSQLDKLPQVVKGTKEPDEWISKVEPGISSFAHNPSGIGPYLAPLLNHAREHIPPQLHKETPIFLLSTAGMRLLPLDEQSAVLSATCDFLRFHSNFKVGDSSAGGPCGSHVRVISGEEEGLFGWIAVNYLMETFPSDSSSKTFGFLDMGGASTQIAFEPQIGTHVSSKRNLHEVRLRLMNGNEISHNVFVTTWLGYGTNQARERYVNSLTKSHRSRSKTPISDPCLPHSLQREETPHHSEGNKESYSFIGTGSFKQCLSSTYDLLNKTVSCLEPPCLFNGVHVPHIEFNTSKFIGVSEYWYSSEHVFGLGGAYDFNQYEKAASKFCSSSWNDIVSQHQTSTGGQEEAPPDVNGNILAIGRREINVELGRLEMQCFKAAWIVNILHEGIGLPRNAELKDGTLMSSPVAPTGKGAIKGTHAPTFQSLDMIEDTAVSWSLGTMILEASKEVTPKFASQPELPHPMMSSESDDNNKSSVPIHDDLNEEARQSPFLTPLFLVFLVGTLLLLYLLRRTFRSILLYTLRGQIRKHEAGLEDGRGFESNRILLIPQNGRAQPGRPKIESTNTDNLLKSAAQKLGGSLAPTRSIAPPARNRTPGLYPNGIITREAGADSHSSSHQSSNPSSLSSAHLIPEPEVPPVRSAHPLYALSLSRNSSQTNLVTRPTASRIGSGSITPNGGHVAED